MSKFNRSVGLVLLTAFSLQGFVVPAAVARTTNADRQAETPETEVAGFFDTIIDAVTGGGNTCIPIVGCVDVGKVGEEAILRELRSQLTEENAPILAKADNVFPTNSQLPGAVMDTVQVLDLTQLAPNTPISAGDYIIPVKGYCLEKRFSSPNGHRYQLAPLGGTRQTIMQDFLSAADQRHMDYGTTQGVVWALRAGMTFDDMPDSMQAIVQEAIPQHTSILNSSSLVNQIRGVGGDVLSLFGYGSVDNFLRSEFGDFGSVLVELMELENDIRGNDDWRSLSSHFLNEAGQGVGGIEQTPWSEIYPGIYGRFITEGNTGDVGALLLRISDTAVSTKAAAAVVADSRIKNLPPASEVFGRGGLTAGKLTNITGSIYAQPEGSGSVQPLAFQPVQVAFAPLLAIPTAITATDAAFAALLIAIGLQTVSTPIENQSLPGRDSLPEEYRQNQETIPVDDFQSPIIFTQDEADQIRSEVEQNIPGFDEIADRIPPEYGEGTPTKKGEGWRWVDGNGNGVRVMPGNPDSEFDSQREPYGTIRLPGVGVIGKNGEVVRPTNEFPNAANNPDAHIPVEDIPEILDSFQN